MITAGAPVEQHEAIIAGFKQAILAGYHGHGIGRHTSEEVHQIMKTDLDAVSTFLGDKPFFFGDRPTSLDATAYGVVANIINVPLDTETSRYGRGLSNLVAFCKRMQDRFFPDL
jgi:glutathione S-transferase